MDIQQMGRQAKQAAHQLAQISSEQRKAALRMIANRLWAWRENILAANLQDVEKAQAAGLSEAMIDRLMLNESRLAGVLADLRQVAELPDPVGEVFEARRLPNGLCLHKRRVPLGVLAVIYEARPNVTIDVTGLALKSGNCVILRGGSETIMTNRQLVAAIHQGLEESGLPLAAVQFIDEPDRQLVYDLLHLDQYVDMVIPRGGAGLHEFCKQNSRIPVITGGIGICHLFVDESANLSEALKVIQNAKVQRPTVCNALDTVLIHCSIAEQFLPELVKLLKRDGVRFKADDKAFAILRGQFADVVELAGEHDFDTEWLSLVLGIRIVDDLEEAIEHIALHSTGHSDGILTENRKHAERFIAAVDSAAVYVNASTRFTDGGQFGLGAEVAISTQRLHARGPMGLQELTTYKWVVEGDYHVRG
ncbi:MAG: glutamate-5-semialdehyde dehydrogenase [Anaerolineales bacterium]|jgi:glutamate-5-semialdehyde dehydrogenase